MISIGIGDQKYATVLGFLLPSSMMGNCSSSEK
uniref:Uncharacterized protein n=1 Tax=Populus trichocarpa TaxID=3694 RepID=A0A3N7EQ26_POPTR